ncbi:uncharacterized protein LOC132203168 isoform X2 [Neocloeon triangulifer]|nr:uncharacterized protein LOC132203168 isoform X2 [Neocloeon triangulifer]
MDYLALILITVFLGGCSPLQNRVFPEYHSKNLNTSGLLNTSRSGKFLPFYTVVRFKNSECAATNGLTGTCYLRSDCRNKRGGEFGKCSKGLGTCCVVTRNCTGTASNSNNTYFRSPGYPDTYTGGSACTLSITKNRASVTHVRLTFTELSLAQPNANGVCNTDKLSVLGADNNPPAICGDNTGQHMYLKFLADSSAIQVVVAVSTSSTFKRRWSILVTQHEQNMSPPPGCLMYFTDNAGQIQSFNYDASATVTRQLTDLTYTACIRTNAGYCSIEWTRAGTNQFSLSGDPATATNLQGNSCNSDFIIIPNARVTSTGTRSDRFCGTDFLTTRTLQMPFTLGVVTDGNENGDRANLGFNLAYQQLLCQ